MSAREKGDPSEKMVGQPRLNGAAPLAGSDVIVEKGCRRMRGWGCELAAVWPIAPLEVHRGGPTCTSRGAEAAVPGIINMVFFPAESNFVNRII